MHFIKVWIRELSISKTIRFVWTRISYRSQVFKCSINHIELSELLLEVKLEINQFPLQVIAAMIDKDPWKEELLQILALLFSIHE